MVSKFPIQIIVAWNELIVHVNQGLSLSSIDCKSSSTQFTADNVRKASGNPLLCVKEEHNSTLPKEYCKPPVCCESDGLLRIVARVMSDV